METYALARRLPTMERFELASQMRRAASSVAANIAEGSGRFHPGDYVRYLSIARGSLMELDTHFEMATRAGYLSGQDLSKSLELIDHVGRMLTRLAQAVSADRR